MRALWKRTSRKGGSPGLGEQISGRLPACCPRERRRSSSISRRDAATGTIRTFSRLAPRPPITEMEGVLDTAGSQESGPKVHSGSSVVLGTPRRAECMTTHCEYTLATVGETLAPLTTEASVSAAVLGAVTRSSRWWTPSLTVISKIGLGILRLNTSP